MNAILKPTTQAEVQLEVNFQALTADWLDRVLPGASSIQWKLQTAARTQANWLFVGHA